MLPLLQPSGGRTKKSVETIPAPAAAGKNTKNAAGLKGAAQERSGEPPGEAKMKGRVCREF